MFLKPRPWILAEQGLEGKTDGRDGSIFIKNKNLKEDVCKGAQSANGGT